MTASLLQRFQGSVVGGVVGDCVGAVFEVLWGTYIGTEKVLGLVRKIESGNSYLDRFYLKTYKSFININRRFLNTYNYKYWLFLKKKIK